MGGEGSKESNCLEIGEILQPGPNFRIQAKIDLDFTASGFLFLGPSFNCWYPLGFVPRLLFLLPCIFSLGKLYSYPWLHLLYIDIFPICRDLFLGFRFAYPSCVISMLFPPRFAQTFLLGCQVCITAGHIWVTHRHLILRSLCLKHKSSFPLTC